MNANPQLLAWHGWAFDHSCWNQWKPYLPDNFDVRLYDRGYHGDSQSVEIDEDGGPGIIFTHSFGLHLCPPQQLENAELLVIFGGFRTFHPVAAQFKRRSKYVLNNMIQSFQEEPEKVLTRFMENTYKPESPPAEAGSSLDRDKLLHDLRILNQSSLEIEPLKNAGKICILHGSADSIVPKIKGRELYNIFESKASYFEVKEAGHALPFTHTKQCWAFIKPEVEKVLDSSLNRSRV